MKIENDQQKPIEPPFPEPEADIDRPKPRVFTDEELAALPQWQPSVTKPWQR